MSQSRRSRPNRDRPRPETWQVAVCRGATGCRHALEDVARAAQTLEGTLVLGDAASLVASRADGPLREHNRLRLAVAGCPNACSRPQIVDFGLIAARRPVSLSIPEDRPDGPRCEGCGACVEACPDGAIERAPDMTVAGRPGFSGPEVDEGRCVACGACTAACPVAFLDETRGWRVLVGGRLGRHPALAKEIAAAMSLSEATAVLSRLLEVWAEHGRPGERIGAMLERVEGFSLLVPGYSQNPSGEAPIGEGAPIEGADLRRTA